MAERDTDLFAAILEDVDVADVGQAAELARAVAPHRDQVADVVDALLAERGVVVGRVADDLGAPLLARVRRESILEDDDVVIRLWDLGLGHAGSGRAQRAVCRVRVIRPVLAPRRDRDPLLEQRVPAQLAQAVFS